MQTAWKDLLFSVPAFLLLAAGAGELARRRKPGAGTRLVTWALRPWAVWALFNLFNRALASKGFNEPLTFPFYADFWTRREGPFAWLMKQAETPHFLLWGGVALVVAVGLMTLAGYVARREEIPVRRAAGCLAVLLPLSFLFSWSLNQLPEGPTSDPRNPGSLLLPWHNASSTLLYAMPLIDSTDDFLRNYPLLQSRLRMTTHGLSHPPGAVLSLYFVGQLAGAGTDIRSNPVKRRYAAGLTVAGTLTVAAVFLLATSLFRSRRIGLLAATLWGVSPAFTAYVTFSQDVVYSLFFILALWLAWNVREIMGTDTHSDLTRNVIIRHKWGIIYMLALGITLSALTMLNYSWVLMTTIFTLFLLWAAVRDGGKWRIWVVSWVVPLTVMTALTGGLLLAYRLDYLEMYRVAQAYVKEWYRFAGPYQWWTALIGGQIDLWVMMGSVACSAFLAGCVTRKDEDNPSAWALLWVVLFVFALPIVFGPNPLKMETSRCWIWVTALPFAFAARELLRRNRPDVLASGAVAISLVTSTVLRLFLNFGV